MIGKIFDRIKVRGGMQMTERKKLRFYFWKDGRKGFYGTFFGRMCLVELTGFCGCHV